MYEPSMRTVIILVVFAVFYLAFLLYGTIRNKLDLYDLLMLSTVALIPTAYALFPGLGALTERIFGVAFPFVIIFGLLFLVLFILVHRMVVKIHRLENKNRTLIQELALLRLEVENDLRKTQP